MRILVSGLNSVDSFRFDLGTKQKRPRAVKLSAFAFGINFRFFLEEKVSENDRRA
jgi:hypothetical protein